MRIGNETAKTDLPVCVSLVTTFLSLLLLMVWLLEGDGVIGRNWVIFRCDWRYVCECVEVCEEGV